MDKTATYTVWAKKDCPYCQKARLFMLENSLRHKIYFVDENPVLLNEKKNKYEWDTVPIIVQEFEGKETLIGGYTDLLAYAGETSFD